MVPVALHSELWVKARGFHTPIREFAFQDPPMGPEANQVLKQPCPRVHLTLLPIKIHSTLWSASGKVCGASDAGISPTNASQGEVQAQRVLDGIRDELQELGFEHGPT